MSTRRVPSYRLHKPSGRAVVTLNGQDFYLGRWQSAESKAEYDRLIGQWLAQGRRIQNSGNPAQITITELVAAYWEFARRYYTKHGEPTGQLPGVKVTLRWLRRAYGPTPAADFSPLALRSLQQQMIEADLSRRYINDNCGRIKRLFRWAVSQELVPVEVYQALLTVPGLKRGRSNARETLPVPPVSWEHVEATLRELSPPLQGLVKFAWFTGCRPAEARLLRPMDVDRSGKVWCYRPSRHKTEHYDNERRVFIGPQAQQVLQPWLSRDPEAFCFSPREAVAFRRRHKQRVDLRHIQSHYTKDSLNLAIRRACQRAGVPVWRPNQLRHACGTEIRRKFGLDAAQVVLGHAHADVTQVYAERNFRLAEETMLAIG